MMANTHMRPYQGRTLFAFGQALRRLGRRRRRQRGRRHAPAPDAGAARRVHDPPAPRRAWRRRLRRELRRAPRRRQGPRGPQGRDRR